MTTYSTDQALYIFTSLTAGSSHIVTATSRLETILRANRVPFKAVDIATDARARMLWGRRAGKDEGGRLRKLPGLVQEAIVLGDLVEIEDWNEYGELKQHVKIYYDQHTIPSIHDKPPEPPKPKQKAAAKPKAVPAAPKASSSAQSASSKSKPDDEGSKPDPAKPSVLTVRSVADEAAQMAKELRLRALREKVHGKGATSDTKKAVAAADDAGEKSETKAASSDAEPAAATNQQSETPDATAAQCLQSPTSRVWKGSATAREPVQSPTSARWRPCSADLTAPASRTGEATGAKSEKVELSETVVTEADAGA